MEFPLGAEERELKEAAVAFVRAELGRDLAEREEKAGACCVPLDTGPVTW